MAGNEKFKCYVHTRTSARCNSTEDCRSVLFSDRISINRQTQISVCNKNMLLKSIGCNYLDTYSFNSFLFGVHPRTLNNVPFSSARVLVLNLFQRNVQSKERFELRRAVQ